VTGGDLMDLEDDDLTSDLGLSRLQVPCSPVTRQLQF